MKTYKKDFSQVPSVSFNRSKFDISHGNKTTFNLGELVPLDIVEVLPGDSFDCTTTSVCRVTSSFIKPVIDNCYFELFHFFIPLRLVYNEAEKVFGNPSPSSYEDNELKSMPVTTSLSRIHQNSVADYMGLPIGYVPAGISLAPFRAFALVYNEWFRNENLVDEVYVQKGDYNETAETFNGGAWSPTNYLGRLPRVAKRKDYFTSCLPSPQKGAQVQVPMLNDFVAPVWSSGQPLQMTDGSFITNLTLQSNYLKGTNNIDTNNYYNLRPLQESESATGLSPLVADISGIGYSNINDIRLAFALQRMLETDARYGSRYNEYLLSHFGVSGGDARLQFTEYLGGGRFPISLQQVAQTSQSTEDSPLAQVGAYSLSNGQSRFSKGFTEHGYVLTVGCVRQIHTYSQGVPKMFTRKDRNDFYDPMFANIGEQPVYVSELYADYNNGVQDLKGDVFGYNEAYAEYRSIPNKITSNLRPMAENSLDVWHFGDKYGAKPVLSSGFITEPTLFFDRTLSVPSSSLPNFLVDLYFDMKAIRVMPTYSIPSLKEFR